MTGTPFDGLGKEIVRGIKKRIRLHLCGTFKCEFCESVVKKAFLTKDFLGRWKCAVCVRKENGR